MFKFSFNNRYFGCRRTHIFRSFINQQEYMSRKICLPYVVTPSICHIYLYVYFCIYTFMQHLLATIVFVVATQLLCNNVQQAQPYYMYASVSHCVWHATIIVIWLLLTASHILRYTVAKRFFCFFCDNQNRLQIFAARIKKCRLSCPIQLLLCLFGLIFIQLCFCVCMAASRLVPRLILCAKR